MFTNDAPGLVLDVAEHPVEDSQPAARIQSAIQLSLTSGKWRMQPESISLEGSNTVPQRNRLLLVHDGRHRVRRTDERAWFCPRAVPAKSPEGVLRLTYFRYRITLSYEAHL